MRILFCPFRPPDRKRKLPALAVFLLLSALAAVIFTGDSKPLTPLNFVPPVPTAGLPEIDAVAGRAEHGLSEEQTEQLTLEYIALTTWAELTHRQAAERAPDFIVYLTAEPSVRCAGQYRDYRMLARLGAADPPESWLDYVLDCSQQDFRQENSDIPARWERMKAAERAARGSLALRRLWQAISPETLLSNTIAFNHRMKVDREEEAFLEFAAPYDRCADPIPDAAATMAADPAPEAAAAVWTAEAERLQSCANSVTEERWPLPDSAHETKQAAP